MGDGVNALVSKQFGATASATKVTVVAGPVLFRGWSCEGAGYVQLFNALAADVTVGTTAPDMVLPINNLGQEFKKPIPFQIGIVMASTSARSNAVAAAQEVNIRFHDA